MDALLQLKDVSYSYRGKYQTVEAVKNATFCFEKGKMYAIMGRSGSGKTTLLSLMAGLDFPLSGEVSFMGTATKELNCDVYRRDKVAVIYQNYNLIAHLTVIENVICPLVLQKKPMKNSLETAAETLAKVGLNHPYHKRYPSMLSGGEQQRVAIARALAAKSNIILADEPTGNLDGENAGNIVNSLRKLAHDEQVCVIIVTHDAAVAEQSDVLLHMADGQLSEHTLEI